MMLQNRFFISMWFFANDSFDARSVKSLVMSSMNAMDSRHDPNIKPTTGPTL